MTKTRILGGSGETILEGTQQHRPHPVGQRHLLTPRSRPGGLPRSQARPSRPGERLSFREHPSRPGATASLDSTPVASGGAAGIGGTAPVDAPAYLVVGFIVKT